ncbi:MAG TPA: GNAT family N-acetyltransferase [Verrucomicrobiales bacterium]|jgi:CelD/BcsL family acetyltransferase involved in cellulose biosynthesis|nr:GNAT family N-acetyltransferase [Verrucomicrobiales bacterium]
MSLTMIESPSATAPAKAAEDPDAAAVAFTFEVFESFASIEGLREAWDQFAVDLKSPVFLTFDWLRTWWDFYGKNHRLRIYVCRAGGDLVGVLPLFIEAVGFWPFPLRVAKLVGTNFPPQPLMPPVRPEWASEVYKRVIGDLFDAGQCDVLSIGLVGDDWLNDGSLNEGCAAHPLLAGRPEYLSREVNTTFFLPPAYEEYIEALDSRERKIRRKKLRDLEKERTVRTEVIQDETRVAAEFEEFAEQHTKQWETEGRPGHFAAWPRGLEFHRALVAAHAKQGRVRFIKLYADDQVVANQYTYAFGDAIYALLPSRVSDPEWHRFSLGGTSQIKLIESSIQDGYKRLESGLGHYEYKTLLNGKESPVGVVRVLRTGGWTRAKVRLFDNLNKLLTLFLHKIWYRRIAPRLRLRSGAGRPTALLRFDF